MAIFEGSRAALLSVSCMLLSGGGSHGIVKRYDTENVGGVICHIQGIRMNLQVVTCHSGSCLRYNFLPLIL